MQEKKANWSMSILPGGEKIGRFDESIKFDYMISRVFDSSFKRMAVELSYARARG